MKEIGFIGLGLIGGSIAKAIKKFHPNDYTIYGHATRQSTIDLAHEAGVIANDRLLSIDELARMDMIFLCSPVRVNIEYLRELASKASQHTLITDVGSVKGRIQRAAAELGLGGQFIGGHPMTGSEKDGFAYSDPMLLENAYYILTRGDEIDDEIFSDFKEFISSLGAITLSATPDSHDYAVSAISHLPHIISAALVNLVRDADTKDEIMKTIAAGGFKDITRISSSSPVMWQNICIENREEILRLVDMYQASLSDARAQIEGSDNDGIYSFFSNAKDYRDSLPISSRGLLPQANDFYIDLADEPGQIANVATILATSNVSIKNIGIVHNREFEEGVLHIELYDEDSKQKAIERLISHHYTIHKR